MQSLAKQHTLTLHELASSLLTESQYDTLMKLSQSKPIDYNAVAEFDDSLGGSSASVISSGISGPGTLKIPGRGIGLYHIKDREIFRPLQYCAEYLRPDFGRPDWTSRLIVSYSSSHIEGLVVRISPLNHGPLGKALRKIQGILDPITWNQIDCYREVYNEAKHDFDHGKDTHRFSPEDAIMAYFVSRKLGEKLYPLAHLHTDFEEFERARKSADLR